MKTTMWLPRIKTRQGGHPAGPAAPDLRRHAEDGARCLTKHPEGIVAAPRVAATGGIQIFVKTSTGKTTRWTWSLTERLHFINYLLTRVIHMHANVLLFFSAGETNKATITDTDRVGVMYDVGCIGGGGGDGDFID